MLIVSDGTDDAEERLKIVLRNDLRMGAIHHVDAGYDLSQDTLRNNDLNFRDRLSSIAN